MSLAVSGGPSNDLSQVKELFEQLSPQRVPSKLYADVVYDTEWIHVYCRERLGMESVIKPGPQLRADGVVAYALRG